MNLNDKMLERAKLAKTPEDLMLLAKENSIDLTEDEAKTYFAKLNAKKGELADDDLGDVAGGRKCGTIYKNGRPVITALNSCEYYSYHPCLSNCDDGYCKSCAYSWQDGILEVCTYSKRYEN